MYAKIKGQTVISTGAASDMALYPPSFFVDFGDLFAEHRFVDVTHK